MTHPPVKQFSGIFISYRRGDAAGHAGRLYDRLSTHFGDAQVFMDIDHIEPGEDFVKVIEDAVGSCEVLLAVIGRGWLASADGASRRLDNQNDFIRLEIAAALRRNIRVIPLLVQGAGMPQPSELPEDLSGLSRRHALELSDVRWKHDVTQLISTLEKILSERRGTRLAGESPEKERPRPTPDEPRAPDERRGQDIALAGGEKRTEAARTEAARTEATPQKQEAGEGTVRLDAGPAPSAKESAPASEAAPPLVAEAKPILFAALHGDAPRRPAAMRTLLIAAGALALVSAVAFVLLKVSGGPEPPPPGAANGNTLAPPEQARGQGATADGTTPPVGMAYVRGGEFTMGRDDGDEFERPAHRVAVQPFFIDLYEVTHDEYEKFIRATGHKPPHGWALGYYPEGAARKPVTDVTWDDARAYCEKNGKRLPGEAEWEFAARGTDGRLYPWGGDWREGRANAGGKSQGMADVGTFKDGASPFGVFDMIGNAWEWTADDLKAYPNGRLPEEPAAGTKVLRGGSYKSDSEQATTTYRHGWRAREESSYSEAGFRCVKDLKAGS